MNQTSAASPVGVEGGFLTLKQTAAKLNVSTRTVRRLVAARRIPFLRVGNQLRFPVDLLDQWARNPDLVAAQWFAGKEVLHEGDLENGSDQEEGKELGRALFLRGRGRREAGVQQGQLQDEEAG